MAPETNDDDDKDEDENDIDGDVKDIMIMKRSPLKRNHLTTK